MRALLVALLISQPCLVWAEPTSVPASQPDEETVHAFPKGKRLKIKQGTFQAYSLDEMKTLLKIDAEYRSCCLNQIPIYVKLVNDYKGLSDNKGKQLILLKNQVSILLQDRIRITAKWKEENKLRHECENKTKFGSWIAWSVAAAATATVAVLAGILVAKD